MTSGGISVKRAGSSLGHNGGFLVGKTHLIDSHAGLFPSHKSHAQDVQRLLMPRCVI